MGDDRGRGRPGRSAWFAIAGGLVLAGCSGGAQTCPACPTAPSQPCVCNCAGANGSSAGDLGELTESASRKMMHDDGAGCMADLARIEQIDAKYARRLVVLHAQCEMLTGRCQAGKQQLATWYREQTNMSQERSQTTAEALAAMHCRGGDSTPRDELLHALNDLSQGAFLEVKDPAFCRDRLSVVQRTAPLVQPRGPDDTRVTQVNRTLFHMAASCLARAGDCAGAWAVFRDNYPKDTLSSVKDPKMQEQIIKSSFDSMIDRCKGKV